MPFDNIIGRGDADALIPTEQAGAVLKALTAASSVLQLCRTTTMSSKVKQQPVLAALPLAYWLNGDTGLKQTTEAAWDGIDLVAEPLGSVLATLRRSSSHLARVKDRDGVIRGVVALEDVLEQLVGEIPDEARATRAQQRAMR